MLNGFEQIKKVATSDKHPPHFILCHHGLAWNGLVYGLFVKNLLTRYIDRLPPNTRILAIDGIGCGDSDWLPEANTQMYQTLSYVADAQTWISKLIDSQTTHMDGQDVKITWIGSSLGGIIGMFLASDPKRTALSKLVLVDIGPLVAKEALQGVAKSVWESPSTGSLQDMMKLIKEFFATSMPENYLTDENRKWLVQALARPVKQNDDEKIDENDLSLTYIFKRDRNLVKNYLNIQAGWDHFHLYDRITLPTLLLYGAKSYILSRELMEKMKTRGPKCKCVEFQNFGHPFVLKSDEEIDPIVAFINS